MEVHIQDVVRDALVEMNQPLRYQGYTFYQASYADLEGGAELSTFAVTRNHGRLIPYVATALTVLGLVMVGSWITTQASHDLGNPGRQYAGLFGTAAVEALIFAPFLYYVFNVQDNAGDVWAAAVITAIGFAGLSAVAWTTRRDLSFMRPLIMWTGVAAMVLIVAALLFGFNLGTWFSVAMIALAGGAILYSTQRILRSYPAEAYVAGAVNLFGSLMLMFWYVLRILSDR